ncbi:MAG: hypothetical protein HWN80_11965 [Candidatus Lokiarchaeota archaeon]|nr:hypothetical protein [Candidatus Lokiarchaeota archaeon]
MTEETKIRSKKGGFMGVVSLILGAAGVICSYLFIFLHLDNIVSAETAAATECRLVSPFFIPLFAVFGILGGMIWLTAGVGFFGKKEWAYSVGVIAVVITLFSSLWPNIPAMESRAAVPGPWFLIFFPNLLVYFILIMRKGHERGKKAWFGLVLGMAFILNFINGIAATTRMSNRLPEINPLIDNYAPASIYMLTMPTNMIASILFGIATIGIFLARNKEKVRIAGLAGVLLAISAGFPLAFYSMFIESATPAFSMFILGPVVSLVAGIFILSSKMWNKING